MPITCQVCGHEYAAGTLFCPRCGKMQMSSLPGSPVDIEEAPWKAGLRRVLWFLPVIIPLGFAQFIASDLLKQKKPRWEYTREGLIWIGGFLAVAILFALRGRIWNWLRKKHNTRPAGNGPRQDEPDRISEPHSPSDQITGHRDAVRRQDHSPGIH